ncbi:PadR family transcriptional regulator [Alicyclobacillus acidoterrestris]|uniref:PadR family transcriptional regulator n=1 Tax=Alicyclobacillus suci TaxID=2816080 RepID=UPI0011929402|nr:helix-turn-helix transcriptional regulator [Alicyclobacillus suci]GEO27894.1 PadR family transcriptional regulator [Alicyclobacillus acidoterrestris]
MRNERVRGYLDGIVLSILVTGDTYGYEIVQKVNERTHGALQLKEGSLYPALKRLEAEHFIEGYWGTDKETGPRRRYYTLTERGKSQLERIRREWTEEQRVLSVFLGRVGLE